MINNFGSMHKQKKVFKQILDLTEPVKVEIAETVTSEKRNDDIKLVEKLHFGYFVPMKQCLTNLISCRPSPYFPKPIDKVGLKNDIFDGQNIKDKISKDNTLVFTVYSDDAEPVNAIGPHTKKHKESKTLFIPSRKF